MAAARRLGSCLGTRHPAEIRDALSCQVFGGRSSQAFSPKHLLTAAITPMHALGNKSLIELTN